MKLRNILFRSSYNLLGRKEIDLYDRLKENEKKSSDELINMQFTQLKKFVIYCGNSIPYYKRLFSDYGFSPISFNEFADLNHLPILTKELIRNNYDDLIPKAKIGKVYSGSTGGSTGTPLKYLMSEKCYEMGVALLYRGWSYSGYSLGDKMMIFAGSSLVGNASLISRATKWSRNFKSISSYGVGKNELLKVANTISEFRPAYIRGYSSSLVLLAEFIIENGGINKFSIKRPKAIFTTAEMLNNAQRELIQEAFGTQVYNQYGLNDGGISAFEDGTGSGFLVDSERAFMESVDVAGNTIYNQPGSLLATSYLNYAFPFLRYDTGDSGILYEDKTKIHGNRTYLKELLGRTTDYIKLNGKKIGGPVLTVLMGKVDALRYQIIQKNGSLIFKIKKGNAYTVGSEMFLKQSIVQHLGECSILFDYTSAFIETANKHKFIINSDD